ncbi:hypothetical protein ACFCXK_00770 [Streptomyces sp. NPDC056269]|uniref:hypothetical protein n=1 Tax=Streptomyces sp. NPDC056269 TaxID=3345768 RepID=UPI0035DA3D2E
MKPEEGLYSLCGVLARHRYPSTGRACCLVRRLACLGNGSDHSGGESMLDLPAQFGVGLVCDAQDLDEVVRLGSIRARCFILNSVLLTPYAKCLDGRQDVANRRIEDLIREYE